MKSIYYIGLTAVLTQLSLLHKQDPRELYPPSPTMTEAAKRFLDLLDPGEKKKAMIDFYLEERFLWHYFPNNDWKGLALRDMNQAQLDATWALLKSGLSTEGYHKSREIIELENVLRVVENRQANDLFRDPGGYYLSIFGIPDPRGIWGWRFEGHHLSLHFYSENNQVISETPGFMGSNPAVVLSGSSRGKEVLREETEKAYALIGSLQPAQREKAIIQVKVPADILTYINRKAEIKDDRGLYFRELDHNQQEKFLDLLKVYTKRYREDLKEDLLAEIRQDGLDRLRLVWIGSLERGPGHPVYYRIMGPSLIIEYDNTQNNANHIHTVIRDLRHDFGGDELAAHYRNSHTSGIPRP